MTLAEQFKALVDSNLERNEWFDGEQEIADYAKMQIARNSFNGRGRFNVTSQEYRFNDGSIAKDSGVSVKVIK